MWQKNGLLKSVWMPPMAFTQVRPVHLTRFLRRRNCISYTNNLVKDRVYDCSSSTVQLYSQLPSSSKKQLQILVNKIHPECESLNLRGCQSSLKSHTVRVFSTNRQLFMKDRNSQPTICNPKGIAPAMLFQSFLCMCFYNGVL